MAAGFPLIKEFVNDILSSPKNRAYDSPHQPGAYRDLPISEIQTKGPTAPRDSDSTLGQSKVPRSVLPPPIPPRPRPLTPFEALYKVVWICGETALKSSDHIDIKNISKECVEKVERLQRSPLPFDSIPNLQFGASSYIADREQPPLYPYGQEGFPMTQHLPIQSIMESSPFHNQGLPSASQLDLVPQPFLNNEGHLITFTVKQSSVTGVTHDQPNSSSPVSFNMEPETQLESPISPQKQENLFRIDDSVPPTLHQNPHDVFPCAEQTFPTKESPSHPDELLNHEEQFFYGKKAEARSKEQFYHPKPSHVVQQVHHHDFFDHQDHQLYPRAPELSISLEGFHDNLPKQNCHNSNYDYRKEIKMNDDKKVERIMDNCSGTEKRFNLGPSKIFLFKVDEKCSNGGSSVCDQRKGCPGDYPSEENCGKITWQSLKYKPQVCSLKKETVARNTYNDGFDQSEGSKVISRDNSNKRPCDITCNDDFDQSEGTKVKSRDNSNKRPCDITCNDDFDQSEGTKVISRDNSNKRPCDITCNDDFDQSEGTKVISRDNSNKRPCDIRNFLSKEQFNELRALLRNIARNHGSKHRGFTEDFKDTQPPESNTSTEDFSCCSKCLNKLCKYLHLAKDVGDFILEKSWLALRELSGLMTVELKNCDIDHYLYEGKHPSFEK